VEHWCNTVPRGHRSTALPATRRLPQQPTNHVRNSCRHSVLLITPHPTAERSIVMCVSVCLCVCLSVRDHIFGTTCPIFTKVFKFYACFLWPWLIPSSPVIWRHNDTLHISSFMDDVILAHKPRLLHVATQHKCSAHAALGLAIYCAQ